jgi:hypothetical protein
MTAPEQPQLTEVPAWGRLLLVVPDHWTRVLLRAELLEEGYDAVGATSMENALGVPKTDARGPVRMILLDQGALSGQQASAARALAARHGNAPIMLLASALSMPPAGPFRVVIRRPTTIGGLVSAIRDLVGEAGPPRPIPSGKGVFAVRMGPPWPLIHCRSCGKGRHVEPVCSERERDRARAELRKFTLEHASCWSEEGE